MRVASSQPNISAEPERSVRVQFVEGGISRRSSLRGWRVWRLPFLGIAFMVLVEVLLVGFVVGLFMVGFMFIVVIDAMVTRVELVIYVFDI